MICSVCGSQMTFKGEADHGQGRKTIEYECSICQNTDWQDVQADNSDAQIDQALTGHLEQLAELANQAGAEGIWIIRGSKTPTLIYSTEYSVTPVILDVEEAGVLVLIRFPVGDGREEGIESK